MKWDEQARFLGRYTDIDMLMILTVMQMIEKVYPLFSTTSL